MRAQAGTKITQALAPGAQQERTNGGLLTEHHVVKAIVRGGELREFAALVPVKAAAIDHDAANYRTVTTQKLGGGVIDQIGPVYERLDQPGRGQRRVHQ